MKSKSVESILKRIKKLKQDIEMLEISKKSNPSKKYKQHFPYGLEIYGHEEESISIDEQEMLEEFFKEHEDLIASKMEDGKGSSIIGEGIIVYVLKPRHKKPMKKYVFRNIYTQISQPQVLKNAIKMAEKEFPELKGKIYYEAGTMD